MSAGFLYDAGYAGWGDWLGTPRTWLLMSTDYLPDATHATVAEVAGDELGVAGYARQALTGPVVADVVTNLRGRHYGAHSPIWAALGPGEAVTNVVLATAGTDDAASPLIAWWPLYVLLTESATEVALDFSSWRDRDGNPLPGGDANTRLLHRHEVFSP